MPAPESMRDRVLEAVRTYPGLHLRGLVRSLDSSVALVLYHVRALEEAGHIRSVRVGGYQRYFPAKAYKELTRHDRAVLNLLRLERPLEIVLALLEFGRLQHKELLEVVGGSKPALTYQLEKLMAAGIVDRTAKGEERGFSLRDPHHVRSLLAKYEPVDEFPAHVHDTWDDLFRGHRSRDSEYRDG